MWRERGLRSRGTGQEYRYDCSFFLKNMSAVLGSAALVLTTTARNPEYARVHAANPPLPTQ